MTGKRKVRMLKDYYPTAYIKDGVWWKGDIVEIDEVKDQVSVDYLIDEGYCEELDS